jgi:hypothetical protein
MSDDVTFDDQNQASARTASASAFFSPSVCSVTAFTLAVVALLGQNVVTVGVATVLDGSVGASGARFYIDFGVATVLQLGIVFLLARRTLGSGGWESTLGRAALLVSGVALVAAALMIAGGVLEELGTSF